MTRWLSSVLCAVATMLAADAVQARADHQEAPLIRVDTVHSINWGGAVSRGPMRVSGLSRIQSARESARAASRARLRSHKKGFRAAPGERISRPDFGAGHKGSSQSTGRRVYRPIRIRKRVDAATPFLRRTYETKRPLPRVVLKGRDTKGTMHTITLTQARITSFSFGGSSTGGGSSRPELVEVELSYRKIHWR